LPCSLFVAMLCLSMIWVLPGCAASLSCGAAYLSCAVP
jgi:hypothetical protein